MNLALMTTLSPAYGRDYKTAAAVTKDFRDGKDFSVGGGGGPYASIRDFPAGTKITLRYKQMRESCVVTV